MLVEKLCIKIKKEKTRKEKKRKEKKTEPKKAKEMRVRERERVREWVRMVCVSEWEQVAKSCSWTNNTRVLWSQPWLRFGEKNIIKIKKTGRSFCCCCLNICCCCGCCCFSISVPGFYTDVLRGSFTRGKTIIRIASKGGFYVFY